MMKSIPSIIALVLLTSCSKPVPGPDKTATGAVLAGGLGAGIGAILGNQFAASGPGIVLGASFAAASGIMTGIGLDVLEGNQLSTNREIESLNLLHTQNSRRLQMLEQEAQYRSRYTGISPFLEVFFDRKRASLKLASVEQINHIAGDLRNKRLGSYKIILRGFSTDFESETENKSLINARLKSVQNILQSNGIPKNSITLDEKSPSDRKENTLVSDSSLGGDRLNNRVEVLVSYL
jgi:outer membrane protein OmpA-like peptidoglycan-associated protein